MAAKRKKPNYAGRYHCAVVCIIIAVVIIVALDAFSILIAICPGLFKHWFGIDAAVQTASPVDSLFSTCLSIIGIAISVWATLNIINALDKNDVAELKNQLAILKAENETYVSKQHYNILFGQFEECSSDLAMVYIAQKYRDMNDLPYAQLSIVMQYYIRVYRLYQQEEGKELLGAVADEGICYTKELLYNEEFTHNKNVILFLHYCLAEFHFYKTYTSKDEKSFFSAINAMSEYEMAVSLFSVDLPKYTEKKMANYPKMEYDKIRHATELTEYFCNTYGECCSKAIQAFNANQNMDTRGQDINTIGKKAIFYCEHAVYLSNKLNQTYLRNLGCAIEAAYGTDSLKGIIIEKVATSYQNAVDICIAHKQIPWKVFYTWLSYYTKCIKQKIQELCLDIDETTWLLQDVSNIDSKLLEYTRKAVAYSYLSHQTYPDNLVFFKFYALSLRDRCVWEIKTNGHSELAVNHFYEFERIWDTL